MELNDGWCPLSLKGALQGVIRGIRENPDPLDVRMQLFQRCKNGTPERLFNETGCVLYTDHADCLHSHGSDGTGLSSIGEPTDLQSDSRVGHSIEELQ